MVGAGDIVILVSLKKDLVVHNTSPLSMVWNIYMYTPHGLDSFTATMQGLTMMSAM